MKLLTSLGVEIEDAPVHGGEVSELGAQPLVEAGADGLVLPIAQGVEIEVGVEVGEADALVEEEAADAIDEPGAVALQAGELAVELARVLLLGCGDVDDAPDLAAAEVVTDQLIE